MTIVEELMPRASRCWDLMDDNERTIARLGMMPLWTSQAGLGDRGEEADGHWPQLAGADAYRYLSLALMELVERDGEGMVA